MLEKKAKSIRSSRPDRRFPFPKKMILQIVQEVESGCCRKKACATYGMAYATLGEWMVRYGSEVYQSTKKAIYPLKQKRTIVRAINEGSMTKEEACIAYKLNKKVLNAWILKFGKQFNELSSFNQDSMIAAKTTTPNEFIEEQLFEARLKIKALETMIDIAEEQFKISIRKKSGAKQ